MKKLYKITYTNRLGHISRIYYVRAVSLTDAEARALIQKPDALKMRVEVAG